MSKGYTYIGNSLGDAVEVTNKYQEADPIDWYLNNLINYKIQKEVTFEGYNLKPHHEKYCETVSAMEIWSRLRTVHPYRSESRLRLYNYLYSIFSHNEFCRFVKDGSDSEWERMAMLATLAWDE